MVPSIDVNERYVKEGDKVQQFDKIAEVQSDKASVDITSRFDGTIAQLHYKQNETAKVGEPLLSIDVHDEESGQSNAHPAKEAPKKKEQPKAEAKGGSASALPSTRMFAKDMGIDIEAVTGTGKHGQVTKEDVERLVNSKKETNEQNHSEDFKIIKLSSYQKAMSKSMAKALEIPHFGYSDEIDVSLIDRTRKQLTKEAKISYLPFIIKSISEALKVFPIVNGHFEDGHLKVFSSHNICVAIDSPQGLVVPVLRNIEKKSLLAIAKELAEMEGLARENKLSREHLSGGTICVSNIGSIGGIHANPLLVWPQVCIGAISRARILPRYDQNGSLVPSKVLNISWAADHRVLDGATVSRFSNNVKDHLQSPESLLGL